MLKINRSCLRSVLFTIVVIISLFGPQAQVNAKTTQESNPAARANSTAGNVLLSGVPYNVGDVFVTGGSTSQNAIMHFSPNGTLLDELGPVGLFTGGLAFDFAGNLYVSDWVSQLDDILKFDNLGNHILSFSTGNVDPTSIAANAAGHLYVGSIGSTGDVFKFDANGTPLASFNPAVENAGTNEIDLAADQCTLLYTSEGVLIKRFNVCTNTQLPDFAVLPISITLHEYADALRIRPNGEVMVSTVQDVLRLNASGTVIQTYPKPTGETLVLDLDLDPDLTSFWILTYTGPNNLRTVYKIDIASGAILQSFNLPDDIHGTKLAIFQGITQPKLTIDPSAATKTVGESVFLAGFLTDCLDSNVLVTFTVTGANPQTGTGFATCDQIVTGFSYTGVNPGIDTIVATAHTSQPPANLTSNTSTITWILPQDQADLSITKSDSPDPVLPGSNLTYTLTVTNNGPENATDVVVTDTLPAGVTFVSATASQGSCAEAGGVVTCALGDLANGASATVTLVVTVDSTVACGSSLTNRAVIASNASDPEASNNTVSADTTVSCPADLSITKSDAPDPVAAGSNVTYTMTVTNNGPTDATGVTVTDTLPAGVTFDPATSTPGCTELGGVVTCDVGNLANGVSATVTITVTVDPTASTGTITNTASVTGNENDPTITNNTASTDTVIMATSSLCPILDDFNRADGPLGSNWDGRTSGYRIKSNETVVRTGGPIYWQLEGYGPDQEACVTLTRINPKSKQHGLLLKVQELNDWRKGAILVSYNARSGNVEVKARDVSNHKWIQVGVLTPPTPVVDGDQLRAKAFADGTVEVLINGTSIGTADAGSFYVDKGGQIGLWFRGRGGEDDDDKDDEDNGDHDDRFLQAHQKDDDDDDDGSSALRALLDDFGGGTLLLP